MMVMIKCNKGPPNTNSGYSTPGQFIFVVVELIVLLLMHPFPKTEAVELFRVECVINFGGLDCWGLNSPWVKCVGVGKNGIRIVGGRVAGVECSGYRFRSMPTNDCPIGPKSQSAAILVLM
jgi:hypothetical protein